MSLHSRASFSPAATLGTLLLCIALVSPGPPRIVPAAGTSPGWLPQGPSRSAPLGGFTFGNVTFTGNLTQDFPGGPVYVNSNASAWGSGNTILALYLAHNSTDLFLGVEEVITGNSLMVFLGNGAVGGMGTDNLSGLNAWGRAISFDSPVSDFAAVYFGGRNTNTSGFDVYQILTPPSDSNSTPSDRAIASQSYFQGANDSVEIGIPLSALYPVNPSTKENLSVSAFVVGGSGSWVGSGIPYPQVGAYNAGGSQATFLVNDTLRFLVSGLRIVSPAPINVAIVFNDHQPVYEIAGQSVYNLPWTEAHATAEYIEQPLLLREFPQVNVTYELSGSLLWQLENISGDPGFNDSFIQGAFLPYSSLNTSQNRSLLSNLTDDYFSVPGYVYDFPEPASRLYLQLDKLWSSGTALNASQYEDAKVLWFLFEVSTDLVEGRLGPSWTSPALWALHNQTVFSQADLVTILQYSRWLTGQVIPAFRSVMWGNTTGTDNTELFTSPFYHPLTPLLLTPSISGPSGSISKGVYASDVLAQMNLSRDQFDRIFGQYPRGLYASEAAVSEAMVPMVSASGAQWTATDEWTLQQSGVPASAWGDPSHPVSDLENLYTPYIVSGANGSSTIMLFRDAPLSNAWAFNDGNLPTATAVADILNYLKAVDGAIPVGDHPRTLVTLMLDGENWQFMSPFADDGIPFLQDLYSALVQNRTYLHTVTPSQFMDSLRGQPWLLPTLGSVATGTWNQGSGTSAPEQSNPSLTQWSGYPAQDWMWQALDQVRNQVLGFQQAWGLKEIENLTPFEQNLSANTPQGNLTRAWYGIYNAEGSDWFFQMAPWTISGANTAPFNLTFQGDLAYALSELHPATTLPPSIRTFIADPNPVAQGSTTWINVSVSGGNGSLQFTYLGLPSGCTTQDLAALPCNPSTSGNFTVRIFVNDSLGRSANATLVLTVSPPIAPASVSVQPSIATVLILHALNLTAVVRCTTPSGACPSAVNLTWTSSDPASTLTPEANGAARFLAGPNPGNVSVSVHASLNGITRISPFATIHVVSAPPLSVVSNASPSSGTVPFTVDFTSSVKGGTPPYTSTWQFGDGTRSASGNVTHTYDRGGSFLAELWVNDSSVPLVQGYHRSFTINVSGLSVVLSIPGRIDLGAPVVLTATVRGAIGWTAYSWAGLPTGCSSVNQSAVHCTPTEVGNFSIAVQVNDSAGQVARNTTYLLVIPPSCGCINPGSTSVPVLLALGGLAAVLAVALLLWKRHRGAIPPSGPAPNASTPKDPLDPPAP